MYGGDKDDDTQHNEKWIYEKANSYCPGPTKYLHRHSHTRMGGATA